MSALQEINDFVIDYIKGNAELLAKATEYRTIEWRTLKVPNMRHMTVVQARYSDTVVLIDVNVSDGFARKLAKEFEPGVWQNGKGEEKARS